MPIINMVYKKKKPQPITTPWIYWNEAEWLISLSSDGSTWVTIADKNLWATTVYNNWDTLSEANCGKYYQWGNNYWFPRAWSVSISQNQVNAGSNWPWNYYSSSTYIIRRTSPYRWDSTDNGNLRWWNTWTVEAMQWPAPSWFHIPSSSEWRNIKTIWQSLWWWNSWQNFWINLKLPYDWFRNWTALDAGVNYRGFYGAYRTSTRNNWDDADAISFESWYIDFWGINRSYGLPLRSFKNVAVQPDSNRTKLY